MQSGFRDDVSAYLGTRRERKKILRDIINVERAELGLPPMPRPDPQVALQQQRHMEMISRPKSRPESLHDNYLLAPSSLKGKNSTAKDALFAPSSGSDTFWLYGVQKVTQSTLGSLANQEEVTDGDLFHSTVVQTVMKKIDGLAEKAKSLERCGILFDIISTSKIIEGMLPHRVGSFIYEYIETRHSNLAQIKFVFVGITDNVNCCAARDVFCRDEMLKGKYIGQTKRTFEALDNVHMFPVMPPNLRPNSKLSENRPSSPDDKNDVADGGEPQVLSGGGGFSSFLTSLDDTLQPAGSNASLQHQSSFTSGRGEVIGGAKLRRNSSHALSGVPNKSSFPSSGGLLRKGTLGGNSTHNNNTSSRRSSRASSVSLSGGGAGYGSRPGTRGSFGGSAAGGSGLFAARGQTPNARPGSVL